MRPTPAHERVLKRVSTTDPDQCWLWQGFTLPKGYGTVGLGSAKAGKGYVHRVMFEAFVGPIPAGYRIDHVCHTRALRDGSCTGAKCDHRRCCNPAHLEAVTQRENVLRGATLAAANAAKTHCKRGHLLSGYNAQIRFKATGTTFRQCRTCRAMARNQGGAPGAVLSQSLRTKGA